MIAGQNTHPPSEKMFGSHFIVKADSSLINPGIGGPYFDPSYGVTYTDSTNFVSTALDGYVVRDLANFPEDTSRWRVQNVHVFPEFKIGFDH